MPESTLSLGMQEIQAEVGFYLGFGRGASFGDVTWVLQQQQAIDSCCKSGLRAVYTPEAVEGEMSGYDWSFMHPVMTLGLDANQTVVVLPDEYGGVEGRITVQQIGQKGNMFWPVEFVGIGQVYQAMTNLPTQTGRPQICCQEPLKQTSYSAGQRFQLRFWPIADTAYTLQFQTYINPDYLSVAYPWPLGGMVIAELILAACLMAAERKLDDRSTLYAGEYQARLKAAISADRKRKPQTLGYNGDRSDAIHSRYARGWPWNHYQDSILVNGVQH